MNGVKREEIFKINLKYTGQKDFARSLENVDWFLLTFCFGSCHTISVMSSCKEASFFLSVFPITSMERIQLFSRGK